MVKFGSLRYILEMVEEARNIEAAQTPAKRAWIRRKHLLAMVAVLLGCTFFLAILTGVFLWRLKTAPLDLSFAKTYVEEALSDPDVGIFASTDSLILYMPDFGQPLLIGLKDVKLRGKENEVIMGVDEAAISLSLPKLLIGQVAPRQLILKKPFVRVLRTEENGFQLGLGITPEPEQGEKQSAIMEDILKYVARPGDSNDNSPLASLESFEIDEARVLIEDHVLGVSWFLPRLDAAFESTRQGLNAALTLGLPDVDGKRSAVRTALSYDWKSKLVAVRGEIDNVDLYTLTGKIPGMSELQEQNVVLNGTVEATMNENFQPLTVDVKLQSLDGALVVPDVYTKPLPYESIGVQLAYDVTTKTLDIAQVQLKAQGVTIDVKGSLLEGENSVTGPLQLEILDLPQEKIDLLWPEALRGDPSEHWIVHHITGGTYNTVNASMNLDLVKDEQGAWEFGAKDVQAGFSFEGMTVDYRPPMMPVTDGKGRGTFDLDKEHLEVRVESGKIQDLTLTDGKVELTNIISVGKGMAHVNAKVSGPARTLLQYAAKDPINLGDKIEFDIEKVKGDAAIDVTLSLPTIENVQMSDVKLDISGKLNEIYVPTILKEMALTGGPFDLKVTHEAASIKGKGALDGVPVDVEWMEHLESTGKDYAGQIKASVTADVIFRQKLGIDLSTFLEGAVPVDVVYTTYADGTSVADVKADLTPVRFFAEPFDYEKPVGVAGTATLKAGFDKGEIRSVKELNAETTDFKLTNGGINFTGAGAQTKIASGQFPALTVGETKAAITFEMEPATEKIKLSLTGAVLDLRPFLANNDDRTDKKYEDPPLAASVAVDKMITAEGESIQNAKLYVDIDRDGQFNQLEMDAKSGAGVIYLRFKPDEAGKRIFRLEADDAGATLKAFDVYDTIIGGKLMIYAEPIDNVYDRNLVGSAEISNFKVVKAPALAQLLAVMSLGGVGDVLNDEGLSFTKLESNFDWLYRPQGSLLILKDGRTSGNSLGLTFDGRFDKTAQQVDVKGTIIPLSGVNEIIGSIPLVGDILTGGTGSLIAATYTMRGDAKKPEVSVNPLSVLTPGILRRILFE